MRTHLLAQLLPQGLKLVTQLGVVGLWVGW